MLGITNCRILAGCLILLAVLSLNPINIWFVRFGILFLLAIIWLWTAWLMRPYRLLRWASPAAAAVVLAALLLPGRAHDAAALRNSYVNSLAFYEGAFYCWGGENRVGIDCSGLVRRGLFVANLKQGFRTLNPRLLRTALLLWWQDASARELHKGYRGRTRPVLDAPSINALDPASLLPGDFAITRGGIHALVYIGDRTWLEADPGLMRVIRVKTPVQGNSWFDVSVHIMRWRQLEISI